MTSLPLTYSTAIPQQIDEKPQQKRGNRCASYTTNLKRQQARGIILKHRN